MPKPTPRTLEVIDWDIAEQWIQKQLGYHINNPKIGQDYWLFLCDRLEPNNDSIMVLTTDLLGDCDPWQAEITRAFHQEFGPDRQYWVEF